MVDLKNNLNDHHQLMNRLLLVTSPSAVGKLKCPPEDRTPTYCKIYSAQFELQESGCLSPSIGFDNHVRFHLWEIL